MGQSKLGTAATEQQGIEDTVVIAMQRMDRLSAIVSEAREALEDLTALTKQDEQEAVKNCIAALNAAVVELTMSNENLLAVLDEDAADIASAFGAWSTEFRHIAGSEFERVAAQLTVAAPQ